MVSTVTRLLLLDGSLPRAANTFFSVVSTTRPSVSPSGPGPNGLCLVGRLNGQANALTVAPRSSPTVTSKPSSTASDPCPSAGSRATRTSHWRLPLSTPLSVTLRVGAADAVVGTTMPRAPTTAPAATTAAPRPRLLPRLRPPRAASASAANPNDDGSGTLVPSGETPPGGSPTIGPGAAPNWSRQIVQSSMSVRLSPL